MAAEQTVRFAHGKSDVSATEYEDHRLEEHVVYLTMLRRLRFRLQRSMPAQLELLAASEGYAAHALRSWAKELVELLLPAVRRLCSCDELASSSAGTLQLQVCLELRRLEAVFVSAWQRLPQQGPLPSDFLSQLCSPACFSPFVFRWLHSAFTLGQQWLRDAVRSQQASLPTLSERHLPLLAPLFAACHRMLSTLEQLRMASQGELVAASQLMADLLFEAAAALSALGIPCEDAAASADSAATKAADAASAKLVAFTALASLESTSTNSGAATLLREEGIGEEGAEGERARMPWEREGVGEGCRAREAHGGSGAAHGDGWQRRWRSASTEALGEGDASLRSQCVQANTAWDARLWLVELVGMLERQLAAHPEQQRIVSDSVVGASTAFKRVVDERLCVLVDALLEPLLPHVALLKGLVQEAATATRHGHAAEGLHMDVLTPEDAALVGFQTALLRLQRWLVDEVLRLLLQRFWLGFIVALLSAVDGCARDSRGMYQAHAARLLGVLEQLTHSKGAGPSMVWIRRKAAQVYSLLAQPSRTPD